MRDISIGKRIQKLRKQHQLSQQELAEKIGISRQTIGKWEQDLSLPDIEMLMAMTKVFDIPLMTLIGVEAETNSISELYDQIKTVQTNLEKSNKSKSILQYVLIFICILSFTLTISLSVQLERQQYQLNEQQHLLNPKNKLDEAYLTHNVKTSYDSVNQPKENFDYIERMTMQHISTDLLAWTVSVHYEIVLKEFTSLTELTIEFKDDDNDISEEFKFEKVDQNLFVLDATIPLTNYNQVIVTIKNGDNYKVENIVQTSQCAYLEYVIANQINLYLPLFIDDFGETYRGTLKYTPSISLTKVDQVDSQMNGQLFIYIHDGDTDYSPGYMVDLFNESDVNLIEDLPLKEPVYISFEYKIYKNNSLFASGKIGEYSMESDGETVYSYFVIEEMSEDYVVY